MLLGKVGWLRGFFGVFVGGSGVDGRWKDGKDGGGMEVCVCVCAR